jgi:hypothetical protein
MPRHWKYIQSLNRVYSVRSLVESGYVTHIANHFSQSDSIPGSLNIAEDATIEKHNHYQSESKLRVCGPLNAASCLMTSRGREAEVGQMEANWKNDPTHAM